MPVEWALSIAVPILKGKCDIRNYSCHRALRKKGIPEVLFRSVMSLYEGENTSVRVDSGLSEEFDVKVGMHQGSVLSPFLFAVVVDVVTEFAIEVRYVSC